MRTRGCVGTIRNARGKFYTEDSSILVVAAVLLAVVAEAAIIVSINV
jgi:hypothetical protein